jgi:hypothetical protein
MINKFKNEEFRKKRSDDVYVLSGKYDITIIADKLYNIYKKVVI